MTDGRVEQRCVIDVFSNLAPVRENEGYVKCKKSLIDAVELSPGLHGMISM